MLTKIEPILEPDQLVFVLGGGPSVTEEAAKKISDYFIVGTNGAVIFKDWVNVVYFGDLRFYKWAQEYIDEFPGRVITACNKDTFKDHAKVEVLKKYEHLDHPICWDKDKICWPTNKGHNTGATAIALACKLGAKNIILYGFDFQTKEERHNYHYLSEAHHTPRKDIYQRFYPHFEAIKKKADQKGICIRNATPETKLDLFPKVALDEVLDEKT